MQNQGKFNFLLTWFIICKMRAQINIHGKSDLTLYTEVDYDQIVLDDDDTSYLYNLIAESCPENDWEECCIEQMMYDNHKNMYIVYANVW